MLFSKAIWITLTVLVLFVSLYGFDGKPNSDIGIFFTWSMLILAFPSSLLVALFFAGLSIAVEELFSAVIPTSYWSLSVGWVCFLVAENAAYTRNRCIALRQGRKPISGEHVSRTRDTCRRARPHRYAALFVLRGLRSTRYSARGS